MPRRTATRSALVTLGLLTLAACVVNLSFSMDKPNIALKSDAGTTSITQQSILVNLGDYSAITQHKDSIKSLDLDYLDITVTAVDAANTASTISGTVSLRKTLSDPTANDIAVGTITAMPIAVGSKVRINGTPALDAFLLAQLQTSGSFYVIV